MRLVPLTLAVLLSTGVALADDVWIDAIHGDDTTGDGSALAPVRTLTKGAALVAGVAGPHTLHVAPGRYDEALGESFPIPLAPQTRVLGSGAHQTIVSGGGQGTLVSMARGALVSDVSLIRGDVAVVSAGQAFAGEAGLHTLRRCVVSDSGIGVLARSDLHSDHGVVLLNSVVTRNGIGIAVVNDDCDFQSVTVQLYGSVVTGNTDALDPLHGFQGCERYLGAYRSVIQGNGDDSLAGWLPFFPGLAGNVLGDAAWVGLDGNVGVAPGFVHAPSGDVHLVPASPVVDPSAPAAVWPPMAMYNPAFAWTHDAAFEAVADFDGDLRGADGAIDIGTDEVVVPSLWPATPARIDAVARLRASGSPGDAFLVAAGFGLIDPPLAGLIAIAPPWVLLGTPAAGANGIATLDLTLPSTPSLVGLDLDLQALRASGPNLDATGTFHWRVLP